MPPFDATTLTYPSDQACLENEPNCDMTRYLVVLVVVLVVMALIMCVCRQFMRLVIGKRCVFLGFVPAPNCVLDTT
uniref:Uncharacterized protein n=1 Tax=Caenorhabditis japonica TaxID=281687 RepID=A0A8R1IM51_CAEJA